MALIRAHPKVGYGILKSIEFEWPVADIVVQHHERLDGSGYPSGIKGEEILLEARILAVADVVEAMPPDRPLPAGCGHGEGVAEITRGQGTLDHCVVVQVCLEDLQKEGLPVPGVLGCPRSILAGASSPSHRTKWNYCCSGLR